MGVTIFISYSHLDSLYKTELEKHLSIMRDNGKIIDWSDGEILPGDKWDLEINKKLSTAKIILLLVSPDFLSSKYIKQTELSNVLERNKKNECRVIPIILRYCNWESSLISGLQAIPGKNGRIVPIKAWEDQDEAFNIVITEIERVLNNSDVYPNQDEHIYTPDYPSPPPVQSSVIRIGGSWRDINNLGNGSHLTQEGNSFQFEGWGTLPNGIQFKSTGSGTITGNTITSRYTAIYQNGWISQGTCFGTVNPNGLQMTLTCTDNVLGTFVSSTVRQ